MDWLSDKPHLYAGAFYGVAPLELAPPRSWYFDTQARELVYRVARTSNLDAPKNPLNDIRFRVIVEDDVLPASASQKAKLRGLKRVEFEPIEEIRWNVSAR
jgi:hypothetical protein